MRREPVPVASLDACDTCGGLWVDWFDGEIQTLVVAAECARLEQTAPSAPPAIMLVEPPKGGTSTCPRCMRPLVEEHYRFKDATDDELVTGVDLLRCTECVGSFVPRASAQLLFDRVREPRAVTLWEVVIAVLKRWVGRDA